MGRGYALVSPGRDEAKYLRRTLDTVIAQTILPSRWVIVDDGSKDETADIVAEYARRHAFIQLIRIGDRGHRSVGQGVIEAFYAGYRSLQMDDYAFVGKLDLDLELPPGYFEALLARFRADPCLGAFSGKVYLRLETGALVPERMGDEHAIGAAKFYRTRCFEEVGGFVRMIGWDSIDGHLCRMRGWITGSDDAPELRIVHLRQMGSSHLGVWTGRMRWGRGKWVAGSAWYYVVAVSLYRMLEPPYALGGLGILWGYLTSMLGGTPRYGDEAYRRFVRSYEIRSLLLGKRRTMERHHRAIRQRRSLEPEASTG